MEYFEIMKSKKAQISTFIIIGLIILIVVALVIYIISQLTKEEADLFRKELLETPLDALPAREFVQSCVNSIGEEALHLIGSSVGYISVKESYKYIPELNFAYNYFKPYESDAVSLTTDNENLIPYWFYLDDYKYCLDCKLSFSNIPNIDDIERQISKYVEENLISCLGKFEELERQGLAIKTFNLPKVSTKINRDSVSVNVDYPISVSVGANDVDMKLFSKEYDVNLFDLYMSAFIVTSNLASSSLIENNFLLNLITLNSGPDFNQLPPISASTEGPLTVSWSKKLSEIRLQELLKTYGNAIQLSGFQNSQKIISNDSVEQGFYDALYINVFNDSSVSLPFKAKIIYPDLPLYFDISPPAGEGMLRPQIDKTRFPVASLPPFQRNLYEFFYTVSFPIIIEFRDESAFNGEGYSFAIAYEVNIRENKDLLQWSQGQGNIRFDRADLTFNKNVDVLGSKKPSHALLESTFNNLLQAGENLSINEVSEFNEIISSRKLFALEEQRISPLTIIETYDKKNQTPLENVDVEFLCGNYASVSLGSTTFDNESAKIETKLPLCFGDGRFEFRKDGYLIQKIINQSITLESSDIIKAYLEPIRSLDFEVNKKIKAKKASIKPEDIQKIDNIEFLTEEMKQKLIDAKVNAPAQFEEFLLDNFISGKEEAIVTFQRVSDNILEESYELTKIKTAGKSETIDLVSGDYSINLVLIDHGGKVIQPHLNQFCKKTGIITKKRTCQTYWIPDKETEFNPWIAGGVELNNNSCGSYITITSSELEKNKKLIINTIFFEDPQTIDDLSQSDNIAEYTTQNCIKLIPEFR